MYEKKETSYVENLSKVIQIVKDRDYRAINYDPSSFSNTSHYFGI